MAAAGGTPSDAGLKETLQSMDDYDFEHLVADLWERQGWDTEVEQQAGDAGVDVRATKDHPYRQKVLIQAKRYSESNPVGGPDIQQYAALKRQESNVDQVLVVTTGRFTSSARDRGEELNVKLIDGDDLVSLIRRLEAEDTVRSYTEVRDVTPEPDTDYTEPLDIDRPTASAESPDGSNQGLLSKLGLSGGPNGELARYHYGLFSGTLLFWFGAGAEIGLAILFGFVLAVGSFLADYGQLKRAETSWKPSILLGLAGVLFVNFLYVPYYGLRRWLSVRG